MRRLFKSWKDKRINYTKRWRWYQGEQQNDIRLNFEDEHGSVNMFPTSSLEATMMCRDFMEGTYDTMLFRDVKDGIA